MESKDKYRFIIVDDEEKLRSLVLLVGNMVGVLLLLSGLVLGTWLGIMKGRDTGSESQAITTFWLTAAQISGLGTLILVTSGLLSFLRNKQ